MAEEGGDPLPLRQPLEIPLTHRLRAGPPYDAFEELRDDLNSWGRAVGLGFVKLRVSNDVKGFGPTRIGLVCDRGGRQRDSKANIRRTTTQKTGCTWEGVAKALKVDDRNDRRWTFEVLKHQHNHEASTSPAELTTHRVHRQLTDEMKNEINTLSGNAAIRARDVLQHMQRQHPDAVITQTDIKNQRARLARQNKDGYTGTQALVKGLEDHGVRHVVRYASEDPDKVIGVFWTHPWCEKMWKRFPDVLQMDNTYQTNKFKMPFFQVTAISNVGSIFNIAFGLVDNEREDGFRWLVEQLYGFQTQSGISDPDVIVTDSDAALKNALKTIFSGSRQQQCIFHINKNVAASDLGMEGQSTIQ